MMAILKLTDICKDYQQGKEPVRVLKNINLTVEKGDYLAIVTLAFGEIIRNILNCLYISLENGRYNASLQLAYKISKYFGKTIEEVFIFEEEN